MWGGRSSCEDLHWKSKGGEVPTEDAREREVNEKEILDLYVVAHSYITFMNYCILTSRNKTKDALK